MKLEGLVHATVTFLLNEQGEVLLGRKTRIIGIGLFNAPGGGIEADETIDQASIREVQEEVGVEIDPDSLERRGIIYCHNFKKDGKTPFDCKIFVTVATKWSGEARASSGLIDLAWFPANRLPLREMMRGDRDWVPLILASRRLAAEVWYAPGMQELLRPTRIESRTKAELDSSWNAP